MAFCNNARCSSLRGIEVVDTILYFAPRSLGLLFDAYDTLSLTYGDQLYGYQTNLVSMVAPDASPSPPPPAANVVETFAGLAVTFESISMQLRADDSPVFVGMRIGQFPGSTDTTGRLSFYSCFDASCSAFVSRIIDGTRNYYPSLALTSTGNPVISYRNALTSALKLVLCNDPTCATYLVRVLASPSGTNSPGEQSDLKLTKSTNTPVIAYASNGGTQLRVSICIDPICLYGTNVVTVYTDAAGGINGRPQLQLAEDGQMSILFSSASNGGSAKLVVCSTIYCPSKVVTDLGSTAAVGPRSMALDFFGFPRISFPFADSANTDFYYCGDAYCTFSVSNGMKINPKLPSVGQSVIRLDSHSLTPVVAYTYASPVNSQESSLMLAVCHSQDCISSSVVFPTQDKSVHVVDMALKRDGTPSMVYWNSVTQQLKMINCLTPQCD